MASYDQPGFTSPIPGRPDFDAHGDGQTAPGSVASGLPETSTPLSDRIEAGTVGSSAVITPLSSSLANADIVPVGPRDVLLPAQADLYSGSDADPLSGLPGDMAGTTGAGQGSPQMSHPNSTAKRP